MSSLRLKRGTNAQRLSITPLAGELIYTTDTNTLYVGDGTTPGGVAVSSSGGTSGFSGMSGFSGAAGATGPAGTSGFSGEAGTSGFSGAAGAPGSAGASGFSGESGATGPAGTSGFSGATGPAGTSGFSGEAGTSGFSGVSGAAGDRYVTTSSTTLTIATGSQSLTVGTNLAYTMGQTVIIAYDVSNYMEGIVVSYNSSNGSMSVLVGSITGTGIYSSWAVNLGGTPGATGTSGFSGFSGATGPAGTSGFSGEAGTSGFSGAAGATGPAGTSGFSGEAGTSGFSGATGPAGTSGFSGEAGTSGFSGAPGASGFSGQIGGPTYAVTNSGASSYTINGGSNPTINLIRGFTYYFNVSASGHPFWIKTAQVTGTGSAYNTGVTNNGTDSGVITFTVPFDAPSTLYYICQFHASMTGTFAVADSGASGVSGFSGTNGASGVSGYSGTGGSSTALFEYNAETTLTSGDPGTGKVLWNASSQTSATQLNISHITNDAIDIDIFLALLQQTETVTLQDKGASANYQTWLISGSPVNNTTYWTIPVTLQTSGGTGSTNFPSNQELIFTLIQGISGFSGAPGASGTSGYSGAQGTSGFSGEAGSPGTSGYSGAQGTSGFSGEAGAPGTSGFSGTAGQSGTSGYSGVTPSSSTLVGDGLSSDSLSWRIVPQNSQSADYTLVANDSGKHILHPSADTTARTFTIPANGSVAWPIGTALTFINQDSAGTVTIAITTDTMRLAGAGTTGSRTLAANGVATAIKITATEWIISGSGLT